MICWTSDQMMTDISGPSAGLEARNYANSKQILSDATRTSYQLSKPEPRIQSASRRMDYEEYYYDDYYYDEESVEEEPGPASRELLENKKVETLSKSGNDVSPVYHSALEQ